MAGMCCIRDRDGKQTGYNSLASKFIIPES